MQLNRPLLMCLRSPCIKSGEGEEFLPCKGGGLFIVYYLFIFIYILFIISFILLLHQHLSYIGRTLLVSL